MATAREAWRLDWSPSGKLLSEFLIAPVGSCNSALLRVGAASLKTHQRGQGVICFEPSKTSKRWEFLEIRAIRALLITDQVSGVDTERERERYVCIYIYIYIYI